MTKLDFISICEKHLIDPALALENERVREALARCASKEEIDKILTEEF